MEEVAQALVAAIDAALPRWVVIAVESRTSDPRARAAAAQAGDAARAELVPRLRELVALDVDAQRVNPLAVLREAVRYPTEVLRAAGLAPVERDDFERNRFPDDDYGLTPATFADFGPDVADAGIAWGAAKAWVHKQRHQS